MHKGSTSVIASATRTASLPHRFFGVSPKPRSGRLVFHQAEGHFIAEALAKDDLNWFAYCGNNPIMFTDPTGLKTVKEEGEFTQEEKVYQKELSERVERDWTERPEKPYSQHVLPNSPNGDNEACRIRAIFNQAEIAKGENF